MQLYLRKHNVTGMKYLGYANDHERRVYRGEGIRWTQHLDEFGYDYSTEILYDGEDQELLSNHAIAYSLVHKIWDNPEYANQMMENGKPGNVKKRWQSKEIIENKKNTLFELANDPVRVASRSANMIKAKAELAADPDRAASRSANVSSATIKAQAELNADPVRAASRSLSHKRAHAEIAADPIRAASRSANHKKTCQGSDNAAAKPVEINGVKYGYIKEAMTATGISRMHITKRCKDINNTNYKYI